MVKKRKRKKKKQASGWFSFGSKSAGKKKNKAAAGSRGKRVILILFGVICITAAVAAALVFLDRYNKRTFLNDKTGPIALLDKPNWFGAELVQKVHNAAGGNEFALNETVARAIKENLELLPWLDNVKAQTTGSTVDVTAKYRRPVGLIKRAGKSYYIDADAVVLEYLPIEGLAIAEIKGFAARSIPSAGDKIEGDDIAAAIKLLAVLEKMDRISVPDAPLLDELATIDVSNLEARKSRRNPHIVLIAKDGTKINWGAAYGRSTRYFEASEKEKVAMLYEFYTQNGTICGIANSIVKSIELREPTKAIPRPTSH
ncbi:MAG: cell division protein FtsQ/DivIB [Planctomycetota bacterium]|jgi:hypothetical protein